MINAFRITCATILAVAATSASAVPITYINTTGSSAAFQTDAAAAGISLGFDGYEDLGPGLIDYGQNLARSGYSIAAASNSGGVALRSSDSFEIIEGSISMILFNSTDPLTFTFDNPITAFALNFRDIDMNFGGVFTYSIDGGAAQNILGPSTDSNLAVFFGVIDTDGFSSVTIDRTDGDGYSFDALRFSTTSVPEPTAALLILAGLAGASLARRRRSV